MHMRVQVTHWFSKGFHAITHTHTHTHTSRVSGHNCPAGSYLKKAYWCRQWEVSPSSIKKTAAYKRQHICVGIALFF